jgi:hypothetical protein
MQSPDERGVQHPPIVTPVPRVAKRHLTRP